MLAKTIELKDKRVYLIDQTLIPYEEKIVEIKSLDEMFYAIRNMVVRGAPAIGVSAAAGLALYIRNIDEKKYSRDAFQKAGQYLKEARPTAVNLFWAVDKVLAYGKDKSIESLKESIWYFVQEMADDDISINKAMGRYGADLIPKGKKVAVQTHCNAGSLATVYWGTALGVIRELHNRNQLTMVYADETRPRLQGGKITAWELVQDNIPVTVLSDNMAAYLMENGKIDLIVVGADRIAANGDVANKIGTYGLAIIAKHHNVPFYVAAPISTIDFSIASGKEIEIEERDSEEVTHTNGKRILSEGILTVNPAFDVTPAELITGIITEKRVISDDYRDEIENLKD